MNNEHQLDKIFAKEHQVLENAENLLCNRQFDSEADAEKYRLLYEEYKSLLRQTTKLVHMADRVQLQLKTMSKDLEKASQVDVLTSVYNRTFFMKKFQSEWKSALRTGRTLALLLIDIDFFKQYNDTYGHVKGDKCLQTVIKQISSDISRPRDVIGRYGGDEFVILLPETEIVYAGVIAENIVHDISRMNLEHKGSEPFGKVTLSIGVTAIIPKPDTVMESLFQQADAALYQAKSDGRNCFRLYKRGAG